MKKIHTIKTLQDVIDAVDERNIGAFLVDFSNWLGLHINLRSQKLPEGVEIKSPGEMKWIDDGKNDIDVKIRVVAGDTNPNP